jgi:threonine dehydrogenase-like Zn-dependent dehydrogenase
MTSVGFGARIVIGGFCLEPEQLYVPSGQMRRLKIYFAAGEEQQDLDLALRSIADGRVDIGSWVGARIGLSSVENALHAMSSAAAPVRTVVDPRRM